MAELEEAAEKGPHGEGPVGIRIPDAETQEKGVAADEQSPKATGPESEGGQDAETLGVMTQGDRGV
jgi:hypothetical protein